MCFERLLQAFARWQPGILFDIAAQPILNTIELVVIHNRLCEHRTHPIIRVPSCSLMSSWMGSTSLPERRVKSKVQAGALACLLTHGLNPEYLSIYTMCSGGTPVALRRHSSPVALRWHSGGTLASWFTSPIL